MSRMIKPYLLGILFFSTYCIAPASKAEVVHEYVYDPARIYQVRTGLGITTQIELSPNDPLMFYNVACFYANTGDKSLALQSLKNAITTGYGFFEWIKRDPDLDSIRNEPEYIELMKGK